MKDRPITVLIVAAAPEDRAAMRDALARDPADRYVVIEAESVFRALELRRAQRPDCLILDRLARPSCVGSAQETRRRRGGDGLRRCRVDRLGRYPTCDRGDGERRALLA